MLVVWALSAGSDIHGTRTRAGCTSSLSLLCRDFPLWVSSPEKQRRRYGAICICRSTCATLSTNWDIWTFGLLAAYVRLLLQKRRRTLRASALWNRSCSDWHIDRVCVARVLSAFCQTTPSAFATLYLLLQSLLRGRAENQFFLHHDRPWWLSNGRSNQSHPSASGGWERRYAQLNSRVLGRKRLT